MITLKEGIVQKLFREFPNSFINSRGEFIANSKTNLYFILEDCETELDVKCKIIEWFSRDAVKAQPFRLSRKNEEYQNTILEEINNTLDVDFMRSEMEQIYQRLGNCINHSLTIKFVKSGYDMTLLI